MKDNVLKLGIQIQIQDLLPTYTHLKIELQVKCLETKEDF